jgi:hypothetical protein
VCRRAPAVAAMLPCSLLHGMLPCSCVCACVCACTCVVLQTLCTV